MECFHFEIDVKSGKELLKCGPHSLNESRVVGHSIGYKDKY